MSLELGLAVVLALALFFLRLVSSAIVHYSRSRLEKYCAGRQASRLRQVLELDEPTALAMRAWSWLTICLGLGFAGSAGEGLGPGRGIALATLLGVVIALIDLWTCQPMGRSFAEPILYHCWPMISFLREILSPALWVERQIRRVVGKLAGRPSDGAPNPIQEEILTVVNEGEREGAIHEDAADMIEGLIDLHRVAVSEIMTPRTDMVTLKLTTSLEEARAFIAETGHSRVPVTGESRDEIIGILNAKDLLPHLGVDRDRNRELGRLPLRKPVYVPESKLVDDLLRQFQHERVHIAIVLDEFGGVAGLVTIEDILEEIVGEIDDEYDDHQAPEQRAENGTAEVSGQMRVDELNELVPVGLPEEGDYDTVGGYIFGALGRIPKAGETILLGEAKFTILESSERKIKRLRVEALNKLEATGSTG